MKDVWNILSVVVTIIRIITDSRTKFIKLNWMEKKFFSLLLCMDSSDRPCASLLFLCELVSKTVQQWDANVATEQDNEVEDITMAVIAIKLHLWPKNNNFFPRIAFFS